MRISTAAKNLCALLLLTTAPGLQERAAVGTGIERETVVFTIRYTVNDPELGVFVLGDLPELASGDIRRAIPMALTGRRLWSVAISIPKDVTYTYRFYLRGIESREFRDPNNGVAISEAVTVQRDAELGPRPAKRVRFYSSIREPVIRWRVGTVTSTPFQTAPALRVGKGRGDGESLFRANFGASTDIVQFFVRGPSGEREPAKEVYTTRLDDIFVQDDNAFSYVPAATVNAPRRALPMRMKIRSSVFGITRRFRVMLPRGYDQHKGKRYPVLYIYDGENAWDLPAGRSGAGWDPGGARVESLIRRGEVGEMIMVAVDPPGYPGGRDDDTFPPDDSALAGGPPGRSDDFLRYLTEELKVRIDGRYRTLPDRANTFFTGFSLGGMLSVIAGWDARDVIGGVGAQSASLWAGPNFLQRMAAGESNDTRFYFDVGDREDGTVETAFGRVARLSRKRYAFGASLAWYLGFGQDHTYYEAGSRLGPMLTFLYPATAEVAARD